MTPNEISHYESLKKQDTANRKLIKKLQLDKQALKKQFSLYGVSQQRELLIAWEKRGYEEEEWNLVEEIKIEFINNFLSNL